MQLPLRDHQLELLDAMDSHRWAVTVLHRRAGKSYGLLWLLIIKALTSEHSQPGRYYYLAPTQIAARAIAWDYLLEFLQQTDIPHTPYVQTLHVDLPNGSRIGLLGVENADRLRGRYAMGVVLDEAAQMPSNVWLTVLRPMLADHEGFAIFTGTPMGYHNLLADMWEYAQTDDEWFTQRKTIEDTQALAESEVAQLRRQLSKEAFAQELMVSFDSAISGAFYSSQMQDMLDEGRITTVTYDPIHPVYAALDLGWADALAVWYFQKVGNAIHCLAYEEHQGMSLPGLVKHWKEKPYRIEHVLLPHDAKVHELGTGKSRLEVLMSLGVDCSVVKKLSVHDGIEAVRVTLPKCWIDQKACQLGLDALRTYAPEFDEVRRVHKVNPIHNWASHGADAMRYLALGLENVSAAGWSKLDYSEMDRAVSW